MSIFTSHRVLRACRVLLLLAVASLAGDGALAQVTPAAAMPATAANARAEQARRIGDLMAGRLDPAVDPATLFQLRIVGGGRGDALPALLRLVDDPAALREAKRSLAAGPPNPSGVDALTVAQAEFLALPADRRARLLADHRRQAAALQAEQSAKAQSAARLEALKRDIATLGAALAGQSPAPADLDRALSVNALSDEELALDPTRRHSFLDAAAAASNPKPAPPQDVAAAQAQLDRLRAAVLRLPPERRAALARAQQPAGDAATIADSAQAERAATQARAERQAALLAARNAQTEAVRLVETERARLLQTRQAQAGFEKALAQRLATAQADREAALTWRRQVRDLEARSLLDPNRTLDADRLYMRLVDALRLVRSHLWGVLGEVVRPELVPPAPPELDPAIQAAGAAADELATLRQALLAESQRLGAAEREATWRRAGALREAMVVMNDARLDLIPELSHGLRAQLLGFGEPGLAQARRELEQIALELQYNTLLMPRFFTGLAKTAATAAAPALLVTLQVLAAAFVFRFWRRQGGGMMRVAQRALRARRPQTLGSAMGAALMAYLYAVRRPLDWMLLLLFLRWLVPKDLRFPGVEYLWIIAAWGLAAAIAFQLADAAMRRAIIGQDPRADLRRRSTRLVTGVGAGVGLVLSLAHAIVGAGALYNWVLKACWLLIFPVAALLIHWWRDRIDALARSGADAHPILAWSARSHVGLVAYAARAMAAFVLVLEALRAVAVRRANDVALLREIFDLRRRRRSAVEVSADEASGRFEPLTAETLAPLASHREPADLTRWPVRGEASPPDLKTGEIGAIVGERGLGKTTQLARLAASHGAADVLDIRAPASFQAVVGALATHLRCAATEAAVARALVRNGPRLICIDDAQAMIRPVISGLKDLSRLIVFARAAGPRTTWALAVSNLAWDYVERAYDSRALVDRVIRLPRWSDEAIAAVIERRTEQAGLTPSFEGLQLPGSGRLMSDLSREARTRAGYFELLTNYADGNPAVALELWRRSLRTDTRTGEAVVRMFPTPPVEGLAGLPDSAFFVLRALLRLDVSDEGTVALGCSLPPPVVADALRRLISLGAVEADRGRYRVTLFWYREAIRALERQNMLVRRAA